MIFFIDQLKSALYNKLIEVLKRDIRRDVYHSK